MVTSLFKEGLFIFDIHQKNGWTSLENLLVMHGWKSSLYIILQKKLLVEKCNATC
jgi:hypothetical protein